MTPHPVVVHNGQVVFSCCGLTQICDQGDVHRVRCESCGLVYALTLTLHYSYTDSKYRYGDRVRLKQPYDASFRTDINLPTPRIFHLDTDTSYEVVEDLYEVINPEPHQVLVLAPATASNGNSIQVVVTVPEELVEKISNQPSDVPVDELVTKLSSEIKNGRIVS